MQQNYFSNLDSANKNHALILIVLLSGLALSCRKEIPHIPGIWKSSNVDSTAIDSAWVKITNESVSDIRALEVFENELYLAGNFEIVSDTIKFFAKMDAQGNVSKVSNGNYYFYGVEDLANIDNELYVAGCYSFIGEGVSARNLMKTDNTGGYTSFPIYTSFSLDVFHHLSIYEGDIIIAGKFQGDADNSIVTNGVERLVNTTLVGMADLPGIVYETGTYDGSLYAVGDEAGLKKWNGSGWEAVNYTGMHWSDIVFAITSYNNELYILGEFNSGKAIKKMHSTGVWSDVSSVTLAGALSPFSGFKVINGILYVYGNGIGLNGSLNSNILRLNGSDWENVGNIKAEIRDLIFFNGQLFAASNNGIYVYK